MKVIYKEWWYKDKNYKCKSKGYFLFIFILYLVINYESFKDFLLVPKGDAHYQNITNKHFSRMLCGQTE